MLIKQRYEAKCLRVIDGDTILCHVACPSCGIIQTMRIRLARIEAHQRIDGVEIMEVAALQQLRRLVEGQDVVLALKQKWPDCYGRLISEVFLGTLNVSDAMLASQTVRRWGQP